jgi:DNA-binding response OmpR family regulator
MTQPIEILVVDDDPTVCEFLRDFLEERQYRVRLANHSGELRAALNQHLPDLVLLDVNLPGEDGLSLARFLREHHDMPVLMISGAGSAMDRILGLEVGADDYLVKPFDPRELQARIKSLLRRYGRTQKSVEASPQSVRLGRLRLDLERRRLCDEADQEIALTAMEFDLLAAFAQRPNRPLSRDQLLELTQNRDWHPFDRSIDIRIARLRNKIEADPAKPSIIRTVRGVGYMLVAN